MSEQIDLAAARNNLSRAIEEFLTESGEPELVPTAWVMTVSSKDTKFTVGRSYVTTEHFGDMATVLGLMQLQEMEIKSIAMEDIAASL